jgi:hypothetical protein
MSGPNEIEIAGLGRFRKDHDLDWYFGDEVPVKVLGGQLCSIVLDGYDGDENPEEFHQAIRNFLSIDASVLREVEEHVFSYYRDCNSSLGPGDDDFVVIDRAADVWQHVRFGHEPKVSRRWHGDRGVYVSLECNCDWEREHGLHIVFKWGLTVNKVGGFDGHVTNSDAYGDDALEDVIYR